MQDDSLEQIYKQGGVFAADKFQEKDNDSIENNADNRSERERESIDLLGENYEIQFQGRQNKFLPDLDLVEPINAYDKESIEYKLLNSAGIDEYYECLNQFKQSILLYTSERLGRILDIILNDQRKTDDRQLQFSVNCVFLKHLSSILNELEPIQNYQDTIRAILDKKKHFYSFKLTEQATMVMNIYLEEENLDYNSIYELLLGEANSVEAHSFAESSNPVYCYFYDLFYKCCRRKAKPSFNLFLLSKAENNRVQSYIQQDKSYFYISDTSALDKKELEEYINFLFQLSKQHQSILKQCLFAIVYQLIKENQQMQKKMLGFKLINDLVVQCKNREQLKFQVVNWLVQIKIIQNFLRESTHSRILREVQPIIRFLYEMEVLGDMQIIELMRNSLNSEQIFKVVQSMLGWLKLQHLFLVFDIIPYHSDRQSSLFISFVSTILSNPLICEDNSRKRKNLIIQENRKQMQDQAEQEMDEQSQMLQKFVKRLLKYLIEFSLQYQSYFMPTLLRLISSHSKLFKDDLFNEIVKLLKNNSVCSLWIIQHWLKIQTARDRGQGKYELITSLAAQGVFELMLALLARHRFSRPVVEKALSVIIFFCRFNKPLQRNITEFLWKALGTTGRDQREREQFFVFLKELVRFEGSITQESVNFIFFQILLSLVGDWFSLRVYDCLQMLFLRLNEDCKLVSFDKDHYKIEKEPLIGMDKFIYIYFNCLDLKVVKKCKDFICKLIANSEQTKEAMNRYLIVHLRRYMGYALQMTKPEDENKRQVVILRLFQLAQKNCLEKDRLQEPKENLLTFIIQTSSSYNFGAKKFPLQLNQKITLSDLRCYIGDNLNPPDKNIELWTKGKLLKGENLTLKQLKLQNGHTITVSQKYPTEDQADKKAAQREQLELLSSLIGSQTEEEFLKFIINKYEGESIQNIANYIFQKMSELKQEYKQKKTEKEDCLMIAQEKELTFATLLVEGRQFLQMMLQCFRITNNKPATWKLLQKLPLNHDYLLIVEKHLESGDWKSLFENRTTQQAAYIVHIIMHFIKTNLQLKEELFKRKQLGEYLKYWLSSLVQQKPSQLEHFEEMMKLLLLEIECPIITLFDQFLQKKEINESDFQIVTLYSKAMEKYGKQVFHIDQSVIQRMFDSLLACEISSKVVNKISKIYILQMIYSQQPHKCYSIFNHKDLPQLLLKYGKAIEFIAISTALQLRYTSSREFLSNFVFKLIQSPNLQKQQKQTKLCIPSFFSCINQLLKITPVYDSAQELVTLTKLLHHLKTQLAKFQQQEIIGYFQISLTLLDRHFKCDKGGQRKNEDIFIVAKWLFGDYLFGTKNPYPFFSCKNIRKSAYQLILKMCKYSDVAKLITTSVRQLMSDFRDSDEKEGEIRSGEFVGIKNLGATCYINSLMQQLYHTTFPTYLLEQDNQPADQPIKLLQLKKIFAHLYCGIRSPVYPNDFVQTAKINGEPVRSMVQQDVNQFFASLMHNIQEQVGNKAVNETICGTVCHQIRGLEQGSEIKNVQQTFLTMMIDIKYRKNLHEAISAFSKPHVLEGENMYFSEVLHRKIRASSKSYLGKLPNLLVITLKRFCWNFETNNRIKINDYFEFPLELQLSRYALPGRNQSNSHYFDYKLCGIIIHSGSAESGHYYSLIKINDLWYEFNDKRVSFWDITSNLKAECFGGNDQRSKNAYMLFYQRVGSNAHGCSLKRLPESNAVLQLVHAQNQSFLLNRLFYDSNYIDFIKELANTEKQGQILRLLQKLRYYRNKPILPTITEIEIEEDKPKEQTQLKIKDSLGNGDSQPREQVSSITQEDINMLMEKANSKPKVYYDVNDTDY